MSLLRIALQNAIGLIFPSRCVICERPTDPSSSRPLCLEHSRAILRTEPPTCTKCGRKMFAKSAEELVCKNCRSKRIYYDAGYSAYIFDGVVRELIHLFKYRKRRSFRFFLGDLMLDYMRGRVDMAQYHAIIPVPLHWWRHFRRGFNQAADLATPLSRHFGVPLMKRGLTRVRYTRPQPGLSPEEREGNIKDAFRANRPGKVAGKKILVIDDIITSGATLNECARVLKRAGASSVGILTLAHPSDIISRDGKSPPPAPRPQ